MNGTTTHRTALRRLTPTPPPYTPPVEDLRVRAVLGRVRISPALAAEISALAYGVADDWRARA